MLDALCGVAEVRRRNQRAREIGEDRSGSIYLDSESQWSRAKNKGTSADLIVLGRSVERLRLRKA